MSLEASTVVGMLALSHPVAFDAMLVGATVVAEWMWVVSAAAVALAVAVMVRAARWRS